MQPLPLRSTLWTILLGSGSLTGSAHAADWYVDAEAGQCASADGSIALPFCSIAEALAVASDGETVWVSPGVYVEELTVSTNVHIIGTGGRDVTLVEGSGSYGETALTVPSGVDASVEGITLRGFRELEYEAAGLLVRGTLSLTDVAVSDMRCLNAPDELAPGPNQVLGGSLHALRTTFEGNFGALGGGLYAIGGEVRLVESLLQNNFAYERGGGLHALDTDVSVLGCTLTANVADGQSSGGNWGTAGGAFVLGGSAYFERSTFSANHALVSGSALEARRGAGSTGIVAIVESCTFAGHSSLYGSIGNDSVDADAILIRNSWLGGQSTTSPTVQFGVTSGGSNLIDAFDQIFFTPLPSDILDPSAAVAPLAFRGGATPTHALLQGDPGIDQADSASQPNLDQRGAPVEGNGGDIGAFELTAPALDSPCAATSNSTGAPSRLRVEGSSLASANVMRLSVTELPPNVPGYFISGTVAAHVPGVGAGQGTLCLGGQVGRFLAHPGGVLSAGPNGAVGLDIDLTRMPGPTGLASVLPGHRRVFQYWHRDSNPQTTTNLSTAMVVDFR